MNLVTGLENCISVVETNLPKHFIIYPKSKTGNLLTLIFGDKPQIEILMENFGIVRHQENVDYFNENSKRYFSERQWKVIRLFTPSMGKHTNVNCWLHIAKQTLEKLK